MNYEKKIIVKMTIQELKEAETEIWRMAATAGQEQLIQALFLEAWPPEGPSPSVDRGDLSDDAWKKYQRLVMVLKVGVNAPTVRGLPDKETGA